MTPDPKTYLEAAKKGDGYGWYYADHVGEAALCERCGDQLYVVRTQKQYDDFLEMVQGAEFLRKDPFVKEIDFTKTVLACTFLHVWEPEENEVRFQWNGYKLTPNGKLRMYYHVDEHEAEKDGKGYASLLYLMIPSADVEQALQEARQGSERQESESQERVLAIETHVNPSDSEFFLYDIMTKEMLQQYVGGAFWVIPGTDHVLYEESVPHFSSEPIKHALYLDEQKVYTAQREDYRFEGLVFSEDHSRVAFLEKYVGPEELPEEKRARSAFIVMCDLTVGNPAMKERIVIPAVDPDRVQTLFFLEDNEFCMMKDGKVYSCDWNSLFREAEID